MDYSPDIVLLHQGQGIMRFEQIDLSAILPQFRWYKVEIKFPVDLLLRSARHRPVKVGLAIPGHSEQAILVERHLPFSGALTQGDIMLLAPGEIEQSRGKLVRFDDTEIHLTPALGPDGTFGISASEHLHHQGVTDKGVKNSGSVLLISSHQQVDIPNGLQPAPEGYCHLDLTYSSLLLQKRRQWFSNIQGFTEQTALAVHLQPLDRLDNFLRRLLAHPRQCGHAAIQAGLFQLGQLGDSIGLVDLDDALRSETGNIEPLHQAVRYPLRQLLEDRNLAGFGIGVDIFSDRFADPFNVSEGLVVDVVLDRFSQILNGLGRPVECDRPEPVLPCKLHQGKDLAQFCGDIAIQCLHGFLWFAANVRVWSERACSASIVCFARRVPEVVSRFGCCRRQSEVACGFRMFPAGAVGAGGSGCSGTLTAECLAICCRLQAPARFVFAMHSRITFFECSCDIRCWRMSEPIEPGLPMRRVIHSEIVFLLTLIIIYGLQLGETVAQETVVQKTTARHTATQENATRQTVAQNTTLQSPEQFLGYEPGERFTPHHRVLDYARHVAETSDRVTFHPYGTTYENRELYYLVVTTPENHRHIDEIRQNNLRLTGLEEGEPTDRQRAILWFSYNVHGNEPSSSEAALVTLYDLADPSNSQTGEWLESSVIIMDPMLNPDGRERYVNWYRQMEGVRFNPDPLAREHHESWPGGRFNHYYFDLNRDWAWQTQKETRQRIPVYHEWMPHIHVDFHEQHYTAPYYFAPAAEPFHEAISDWQREFQTEIGRNHMRYFDEKGWLYFTREVFDLFYPSYGDTWPTFNGAVGMTYEQAGHSRAGRGIQLPEGEILTLRDRLEHHYVTGMSTIEITSRHADRVVREFAAQFEGVLSEPEGDYGSYLIRGNNHPDKIHSLLRYLDDQQIRYGLSGRSASVEGYDYQSGEAGTVQVSERDILISARQPQSRLVQTLFEPQPALSDSVTYDITAWEAHYRFGLEGSAITSLLEPSQPVTAESYRQQFMDEESQLDGEPTQGFQNLVEDQEVRVRSSNQSDTVQREGAETGAPAGERRESLMRTTESDSPYAWVLPWNSMDDARFLAEIMRHDVRSEERRVGQERGYTRGWAQ